MERGLNTCKWYFSTSGQKHKTDMFHGKDRRSDNSGCNHRILSSCQVFSVGKKIFLRRSLSPLVASCSKGAHYLYNDHMLLLSRKCFLQSVGRKFFDEELQHIHSSWSAKRYLSHATKVDEMIYHLWKGKDNEDWSISNSYKIQNPDSWIHQKWEKVLRKSWFPLSTCHNHREPYI